MFRRQVLLPNEDEMRRLDDEKCYDGHSAVHFAADDEQLEDHHSHGMRHEVVSHCGVPVNVLVQDER